MNLDQILKERRSIHAYQKKPIPLDRIYELLEAAGTAPSAGDTQNWEFILVHDAARKKELAKACMKQEFIATAPWVIIVCNNTEKLKRLYPSKGELFGTQNVAVAAQNLLLKAESMGLSTCWIGAFTPSTIQHLLEIPADVIPEIILTVGYAAAPEERELPWKQVRNTTFLEKYGNMRK